MIEYQNAKQNVNWILGLHAYRRNPEKKNTEHGFINEKINRELS